MKPTVDGQPTARPEPMRPMNFLNLDLPTVHEVPLEMWFEAAGWIDTVRDELLEVAA